MAHKSVVVSMTITLAGRGHNCRSNKRHRIEKGDSRLTIKEDGDDLHYCLHCAKTFLNKGLERLGEVQTEVEQKLSELN